MSDSARIAVVTGAAQGLGRAIALRLADDGLDVAVNDLLANQTRLDGVVSEIRAKGRRSLAVCADISTEDGASSLINSTVKELGGVDVLVANAGITRLQSILETTADEFDLVMRVNTLGVMLLYKYAAAQMIKQGRGGRLIGACSASGKRAFVNVPSYAASKFALRGLTHSASQELQAHGITVNNYAPGDIATNMFTNNIKIDSPESQKLFEELQLTRGKLPLGTPEVVASLVSYIAKPEAYFISGQTISVDGGVMFD